MFGKYKVKDIDKLRFFDHPSAVVKLHHKCCGKFKGMKSEQDQCSKLQRITRLAIAICQKLADSKY